MIRFYNHLPFEELQREFTAAEYIISRSGYSTVMDIMALQKKSILIPTPGQTEQEYLGNYLMEKKLAITVPQDSFSLTPALNQAGPFPYETYASDSGSKPEEIVDAFLADLQSRALG